MALKTWTGERGINIPIHRLATYGRCWSCVSQSDMINRNNRNKNKFVAIFPTINVQHDYHLRGNPSKNIFTGELRNHNTKKNKETNQESETEVLIVSWLPSAHIVSFTYGHSSSTAQLWLAQKQTEVSVNLSLPGSKICFDDLKHLVWGNLLCLTALTLATVHKGLCFGCRRPWRNALSLFVLTKESAQTNMKDGGRGRVHRCPKTLEHVSQRMVEWNRQSSDKEMLYANTHCKQGTMKLQGAVLGVGVWVLPLAWCLVSAHTRTHADMHNVAGLLLLSNLEVQTEIHCGLPPSPAINCHYREATANCLCVRVFVCFSLSLGWKT